MDGVGEIENPHIIVAVATFYCIDLIWLDWSVSLAPGLGKLFRTEISCDILVCTSCLFVKYGGPLQRRFVAISNDGNVVEISWFRSDS